MRNKKNINKNIILSLIFFNFSLSHAEYFYKVSDKKIENFLNEATVDISCSDLTKVSDGIYNDLCQFMETSYKDKDLVVVNNQAWEVDAATPLYAFSCPNKSSPWSHNSTGYPTHSEAQKIAGIINSRVYTPYGSYREATASSSQARGLVFITDSSSGIINEYIYKNLVTFNGVLINPKSANAGTTTTLRAPTFISSKNTWYGSNTENTWKYNRAFKLEI